MGGLLFGAIIGAAIMYFWGDRVRETMPWAKDRAAEALGKVGESAEEALDRARTSVHESVTRGQEALRTKTGGNARETMDPNRQL
jgi:hypothetical protein